MTIPKVGTIVPIFMLSSYLATFHQSTAFAQNEPGSEAIAKEAENLIRARKRVGEQLTITVDSSDLPIKNRQAAARLLGELQYIPALDDLIRNVDLVDPAHKSLEERPDLAYPVTTALAAFGNAAVPQIVDAYLAERNQQRQMLFAYAIRFGRTTDVALRYLRGTEPPRDDDWLKKQNIEALKEQLEWLAERKMPTD